MKRILTLLLAATLLALTACAQAGEALITQEKAAQIAADTVKPQCGLSEEQFAALGVNVNESPLEGHSGNVWSVAFSLNLDGSSYALYWVTVDQKSGTVLLADVRPEAYNDALRSNEGYKVMAEWEKTKGSMYYWSQEDTVEWFQKYGDGCYKMPGEGDLSRDEALAIAKKYAMEQWGYTAEYLDGLPACTNLAVATDTDPPMWYIYFVDENIRSSYDDIVAPHMVLVANPSGEVLGGFQGDTDGVG